MRAIEIKNRFTSKVIYRHEFENNTLKITCMRAVLDKINLRGANLSDADLSDADLRDADLRDADLRGANLSDANLRGANLRDANLRGADLSDTNLRGADLSDTNLRGANLSDADLRGAAIIIYGLNWEIFITNNHIRIGCQSHSLADWIAFDDNKISFMHPNALGFWKENKEFIINKCKGLTK